MELISIAAQTRLFFLSCGMGFLLGVLYDVFRLLRQIKKTGKIWVFACDFIYCVLCTFFSFSFILAANKGEVRWYILFGEFAGWLIYCIAIADITASAAKSLRREEKSYFPLFFAFSR